MKTPFPQTPAQLQAALPGFATRFRRTLVMCREVTRRVWGDPELGPRYRSIIRRQMFAVLVIAGLYFALGVGVREVTTDGPARLAALVASVWAVLLLAHVTVIALSYRFHDQLTRKASLLLGVYPEDDEETPRVKLDLRWIKKRFRRQVRGFMVMVPGFVFFWILSLFVGSWVSKLLGAWWVVHWWVVFSLAKTAYAWNEPAIAEPWYARLWDAGARRLPPLRWPPLDWWRRYLSQSATSMWSPLSWLERRVPEGVALSLLRLFANAPGLGFVFRPLLPLYAYLVLEHGDGALDFVRGAPLQDAQSEAPATGAPAPPGAPAAQHGAILAAKPVQRAPRPEVPGSGPRSDQTDER